MKKILSILMVLFLIFCFSSCKKNPIDEILDYTITVEPTEEGNLRMNYHIEWKVLNDKKEGPLEWVLIGVPNQYVYEPKAHSNDIKSISFKYSSDEGSFIRCDLARSFYKDEVAVLDFSFLQTHFYTLKDDEVQFQFKPGWFDEIQVKHLAVYWEKEDVKYWNKDAKNINTYERDEYLVWETALDYGETIEVDVVYDQTHFTKLDPNNVNQDTNNYMNQWMPFVVFGVIALIFILIVVISYMKRDEYFSYRGFSGHRSYFPFHHSYHSNGKVMSDPRIVNSGHRSGGSSCACACACACAGGGRAGCSRKDFYQPNVKIEELKEKLEEI